MSTTVKDGATITKDPSDISVYTFDWDAEHLATGVSISTSTWTLTGVSGDTTNTPMTKDQPSIVTGNRKTQIRLSAGAAGSVWKLDNAIVTDESPAQTKERSIRIRVEQR